MKISAENQFRGVVSGISEGAVNATIRIAVSQLMNELIACVPMSTVKSMGLQIGTIVTAVFSASKVIVSPQGSVSSKGANQIDAVVTSVMTGAVNAEVKATCVSGDPLAAIVSMSSIVDLGIEAGQRLTVIIKPTDIAICVQDAPSGTSTKKLLLVNNIDGLPIDQLKLLGHAALLVENESDLNFSLYNFCPKDNTSPDYEGSIGRLSSGSMSFYDFKRCCVGGGVWVDNGFMSWREGFDRYIEIDTSESVCSVVRNRAEQIAAKPYRYNVLFYNCLTFILDALACALISVYDSFGADMVGYRVPNAFFENAKFCSIEGFHAAKRF